MFTFEKKINRAPCGRPLEFAAYVYEHKKDGKIQIVMRMSREIFERAGWFIGDYAIPSVESGKWKWSRTSDSSRGYMVTSTEKKRGKAVYVKVTVDRKTADAAIPGGRVQCRVISSDARAIEAVQEEAANG